MKIAEANNPFSFGIQNIISKKGLKQSYVAEKAGYSTRELSNMINGRKLIKACDIIRLSSALGVTLNEIYEAGLKGE